MTAEEKKPMPDTCGMWTTTQFIDNTQKPVVKYTKCPLNELLDINLGSLEALVPKGSAIDNIPCPTGRSKVSKILFIKD